MNQQVDRLCKNKGEFIIPSSKSFSQRVLACALISEKPVIIYGLGNSEDEQVALKLLKQSNKIIQDFGEYLLIQPNGELFFSNHQIDFHESGLAARMFTPILSNYKQYFDLTGANALRLRPMHVFDQTFDALAVDFKSSAGFLPFQLKGGLSPKSLTIDGSQSSQFITGLIYAYVASPRLKEVAIQIQQPKSTPYIELSLDVLRHFGVDLTLVGHEIQMKGPYALEETTIHIEGDWSSASFFLVMAALQGAFMFNNLNPSSKQADIRVLDALKSFGAKLEWKGDQLCVTSHDKNSFVFDATDCPDLFPPLAVLASFGTGTSILKGVHRLATKESNRAETICLELTKLGADIQIKGDEMWIHPKKNLKVKHVSSHNDHRIAMACAIFGLFLEERIVIEQAESVNKSFPSFFQFIDYLTS